jgi:hypothetical protein
VQFESMLSVSVRWSWQVQCVLWPSKVLLHLRLDRQYLSDCATPQMSE